MITIDRNDDATELRLAGRLSRREINELERCLRAMAASRPPGSIVVDVTDVMFVDGTGDDLHAQIHQILPQWRERFVGEGRCLDGDLGKLHEQRLPRQR